MMQDIILVLPTIKYKNEIMAYREDFLNRNDSLDGSAGLANAKSFEDWLANIKKNSNAQTVAPNLVPASTYLVIRKSDSKLVGMVDIRHELNEQLLFSGGHIGYSVIFEERKKSIAKEILRLALVKCSVLGIEEVLLTCNQANIASEKTILANGGKLENIVNDGGINKMRYWIKVSNNK